jgi:hypothetical protein
LRQAFPGAAEIHGDGQQVNPELAQAPKIGRIALGALLPIFPFGGPSLSQVWRFL